MGQVVRRSAAIRDIFADARLTLERAEARGGEWKRAAERHLGSLLSLATSVERLIEEADRFAVPMNAELLRETQAADALVARISDACWNAMGRPTGDPTFDLVFATAGSDAPEATRGDITDLPDRMELLEDLLRSGLHPGITPAMVEAFAVELTQAASVLRAKVDAARPVPVRYALATRLRSELAREVQGALVALARLWRADGHPDAEIYQVIPDRT